MDRPLMVCESTQKAVPQLVEQLYQEVSQHMVSAFDHLTFMLHCLMLECQFSPSNVPVPWRKSVSCHTLNYRLTCTEHQEEATQQQSRALTRCVLQILPSGTILANVINGLDQPMLIQWSGCQATLYVTDLRAEPLAARYRRLSDLSREFKNHVGLPLRHYSRIAMGLPPSSESILCLPNEVILMIVSKLRCSRSTRTFGATCHRLYQLTRDRGLHVHTVLKKSL